MAYPNTDECRALLDQIQRYAEMKHEFGAKGVREAVAEARRALAAALRQVKTLPADPAQGDRKLNDLGHIRSLRPKGPRRLWKRIEKGAYRDRLEGALLARCAGCTLGAPVEGWPIERMEALAQENGMAFPPDGYWRSVPDPFAKRYGMSERRAYTRGAMDGVPVDDDTVYTLLGLLILEESGPSFTVEDVGRAWLKHLPLACTAEKVALENLRQGVPTAKAADKGNPYCEWIGADIRSDPWGYAAPGWPEKAAEMAWSDAYLSHRREGIYGAMFFSAAIAAAFAVDDPVEALRIGLTEIPAACGVAKAVKWALKASPDIKDYRDAAEAAAKRFPGMHKVHTVNNACLTVWGITIGGRDVSKVIGETVAMGYDNDCTAATAGSLVGTVVGRKGVPAKWTRRFRDTIHAYLIGRERWSIADVAERFGEQAQRVFDGS